MTNATGSWDIGPFRVSGSAQIIGKTMATLTESQQESIRTALGHKPLEIGGDTLPNLTTAYSAAFVDQVASLLTDLTVIEGQLRAIRLESAAVELEDMKLDYKTHFKHLQTEKNTILDSLSTLLDIPRQNARKSRSLAILHYQ